MDISRLNLKILVYYSFIYERCENQRENNLYLCYTPTKYESQNFFLFEQLLKCKFNYSNVYEQE